LLGTKPSSQALPVTLNSLQAGKLGKSSFLYSLMKISIDGNIGAGKSAVLDAIATFFPDIPVRKEPVEEWSELLRMFYADPSTWALAFNLKVLMSFCGLDAQEDLFVERSPLSCRHVFGHIQFSDKSFDKLEWDIFNDYCDLLEWSPEAVIFINTPAATCLKRIEKRGRQCEKAVNLEYLKRVEYQYEAMLRICLQRNIPVVVIDGTQPEEQVKLEVISTIMRLLSAQSQTSEP